MSGDTEDKKCRLCGRADAENEHIFESRDRNLLKKIAAVYSIWITYHDPLPKCICSKCYTKVISSYRNISQVKKLQSKWIENVHNIEPDNSYIEVLSFLERANIEIKNFVQTNFGEKLQKDAIENLLVGSLAGWKTPTPSAAAATETNEKLTESSSLSFNIFNTSSSFGDNENETSNSEKNGHNGNGNSDDVEDDDLPLSKKPKLETTTPIPTIVKCKYCVLKFESLKELAIHQVEHLEIKIPKLFQPKCLNKNFRRGRLISVQSRQSIRCLNCYLVFDDNKCILDHWSKAECDFYCQICGEEFAQSPKLLRDHISEVHGISYRSLKMQRDLAYLNNTPVQQQKQQQVINNKSKQQKVESPTKANLVHIKPKVVNTNQYLNQPILTTNGMEVTSSTTTSTAAAGEGVGGTSFTTHTQQQQLIKCRICNRDFRNFKACNSHMRAHKPPYAYNDSELLPDMNADAYMEPEPTVNFGLTTPPPLLSFPQQNQNNNNITSPIKSSIPKLTPLNNNLNMQPKNTSLKQIQQGNQSKNSNNTNNCSTMGGPSTSNNANINNNLLTNLHDSTAKASTSTAPRGIRMKFVTRRSDLNSSNASISVKSLNDLQNLQTNQALQNLKYYKNIIEPFPPQQQHTSVIVNNLQQQQPTPSAPRLNTFEPKVQLNPPITTIIKDEPMEFI